MALIEWLDMFSVGDPAMDADHQTLVELLNTLYDAWANGEALTDIEAVFDELTEYTIAHFMREEVVLGALDYERLDIQKSAHEQLLARLETFQQQHLSGSQPSELTEGVVEFLRSWVLNHILEEDMQYKPLLTSYERTHHQVA